MTQLSDRLVLDLADALARDAEDLADLLERVRLAVVHAETQAQDVCLTLCQRVEDLAERLGQQRVARGIRRTRRIVVLNEGADGRILLVADRRIERQRVRRRAVRLDDLLDWEIQLLGDLLERRLAAELLHELAVAARGLVDDLHHMHRNADRSCLIGNGARDRLPDPPGRICREFVSLCIVELVHRADQARVALLNEVEDMQAAAGILLRNGDDKAQVCLGQLVLGLLIALGDAAGKILLLLCGEQRYLTDLLQIHADGIVQIIFCCQLDRIDQRFFLIQVRAGHVEVVQQALHRVGIVLGVPAHDLNADGFKRVVDLFDLIHGKIHFFQRGHQLRGAEHTVAAPLADERVQRSHQFLCRFSVFLRGSHSALPCSLIRCALSGASELIIPRFLRQSKSFSEFLSKKRRNIPVLPQPAAHGHFRPAISQDSRFDLTIYPSARLFLRAPDRAGRHG